VREIERKEQDEFDRVWTHLLFEDLTKLGHDRGFRAEIRPSLNDCISSVHLLPLVDYSWKRFSNGQLRSVELSLQCDWSKRQEIIVAAFEKLLMVESPYKVLVCQQMKQEEAESLFSMMKEMIDAFQSSQEVQNYLIAIWVDDHFESKEFIA
ncbi:MAG: hypothetical protein ACRC9Q_06330, partial [Bacteroidales bacterium]